MKAIISGTGSALPNKVIKNADFIHHTFYDKNKKPLEKSGSDIIQKLESITGITERRYILDDEDSIPLMTAAAKATLANAGLAPNDLQGIIVAHNAGNMLQDNKGYHSIPNLAALLKNALNVSSYQCFAYDILMGCPGWLQAIITAKQILADDDSCHNILVLGIEVASRFLDPHDLDSMILADGSGACVISRGDVAHVGILSTATFSHALEDISCIYQGDSNSKDQNGHAFFKMNGRDVYKYATTWVPKVIKQALDKAGKSLEDVDLFLFHQANAKLLSAIANNLAVLYDNKDYSFEGKIPSTIEFLGNTSVATIPTMLDLIRKDKLKGYEINRGSLVVMASVGAGMHCNAVVYQF